ncbi:N-carbamoylputrescine amidase [Thermosynechococcus sp. GLH187]|uniref:N-carbamoylputrescine amidase n=1 Tax=unclassified Thermosynechococcus TaxID=2622553 RepID=UPI0019807DBD|nr:MULTISPECIES: N-carbamoylputrescine amidase [unclassified Thermosynechococcus]QSF50308.1 N-carbamoylputrescine amidase [Thermosynechococcus sp. TA-1]WNC23432.1 N-carbamoylputrescine amidase [Thermosynechococcus sp. PP22]WNC46288.1 N-carbamoylputrescine amidase [Thermosynechococcus sp. GLH187]WNC48825.1 N-carbamoylputrescine amidase [Thermosynechococcus sp. GLH333]WNC51358.1 N-carbamoylputrescine amidase [Thermosynechococcus sp. GLH87]
MRTLTVAAIQAQLTDDVETNILHLSDLVRQAHQQGAQVIVLPELFEGHYFCKEERESHFQRAHPVKNHPTIAHFEALARELAVVIPVSFFEKAGTVYYNSVAMIDAGGVNLGVYRKSHIPDGPGYEEKFYFRPGNTGFRVWRTRYGKIGVGICWDQWFPEAARVMTLMGAEVLVYPTAIGSEPHDPTLDTKDPWQRVMVGHAVANVIPVVAANRVGDEGGQLFYGSSFIANPRGDLVAEADRTQEAVLVHEFDLEEIEHLRAAYGFFRDRRPGLYKALLTADGVS